MEQNTPQLENGYTRIANEILEKLCAYRISGEEWMVLLTILRKTFGFHKKEDIISISQFYEATGLAKSSICRSLNKLIEKEIIYKKVKGISSLYSFNKIFNTWKPFTKKRPIYKKVNSIYKKVNNHLQKSNTQKIKDNIQKIISPQAEMVEFFSLVFKKKTNTAYKPFKTDYMNMAELLKTYSKDELKRYIGWFVNWENWRTNSGKSIGVFFKNINHVISSASPFRN